MGCLVPKESEGIAYLNGTRPVHDDEAGGRAGGQLGRGTAGRLVRAIQGMYAIRSCRVGPSLFGPTNVPPVSRPGEVPVLHQLLSFHVLFGIKFEEGISSRNHWHRAM